MHFTNLDPEELRDDPDECDLRERFPRQPDREQDESEDEVDLTLLRDRPLDVDLSRDLDLERELDLERDLECLDLSQALSSSNE